MGSFGEPRSGLLARRRLVVAAVAVARLLLFQYSVIGRSATGNSSVARLVDLTRIRSEYRKYLETLTELARLHGHSEGERWARLRNTAAIRARRRSVNSAENMYLFSQDVIAEAKYGRGMRLRLAKRWDISVDTAKSRMRLLRNEGWITGGSTSALPGPTYLQYQQAPRTNELRDED